MMRVEIAQSVRVVEIAFAVPAEAVELVPVAQLLLSLPLPGPVVRVSLVMVLSRCWLVVAVAPNTGGPKNPQGAAVLQAAAPWRHPTTKLRTARQRVRVPVDG